MTAYPTASLTALVYWTDCSVETACAFINLTALLSPRLITYSSKARILLQLGGIRFEIFVTYKSEIDPTNLVSLENRPLGGSILRKSAWKYWFQDFSSPSEVDVTVF